jgi:16S rRNA processing protein RimM
MPCLQDLVGLQVFMQASGEEVGRVTDVFDGTGTHDVMRIQLAASQLERLAALAASSSSSSQEEDAEAEEEDEEEAAAGGSCKGARHVLLPFVKAMVPVVDVKGGRMEITPPAGLLELAAPSNLRRPRRENRGKRERRRTRPRGQSALDSGDGVGGSSVGSSPAASGEE